MHKPFHFAHIFTVPKLHFFWLVVFCLFAPFSLPAQDQKPTLELGKKSVAVKQAFTITITSPADLPANITFPDIKGMPKAGTSSSSSTTIINGNISSTQSITQRYSAVVEGSFRLPPFSIKISDLVLKSAGATITVVPAETEQRSTDPFAYDPLEDFFEDKRARTYQDIKEDAFLALSADKESVYAGEGFNMKLSLLVADNNKAEMDFYDLPNQLSAITKKIKPNNCWEENFGINSIEPINRTINGKAYKEYRIWQASLYPLDNKTIRIPSIGLKMVKYKVSRDPFFAGLDRQQAFTNFRTKPLTIIVKNLPPHPMRGQVAVGFFTHTERIAQPRIAAGTSTAYTFSINGDGNISAITFPKLAKSDNLEVYPPTISQNVYRDQSRVFGEKKFSFLLQPNAEGSYQLGQNGFKWMFFNTKTARYDSLVSRITLRVFPSTKAFSKATAQYDATQTFSNRLIYLDKAEALKTIGNMVLLFLVLATAGTILWRR